MHSTFTGGICANGGALSSIGVSWAVLNSVFTGNKAIGRGANPARGGTPGGGSGGAIYTDGNTFTVTLSGTVVRDNHANEGGGAIFFVSNDRTGTLTLKSSSLKRNRSAGFETAQPPRHLLPRRPNQRLTRPSFEAGRPSSRGPVEGSTTGTCVASPAGVIITAVTNWEYARLEYRAAEHLRSGPFHGLDGHVPPPGGTLRWGTDERFDDLRHLNRACAAGWQAYDRAAIHVINEPHRLHGVTYSMRRPVP
nr:hypothetical protein GCM10020092_050770 [Actinoplanes digitatis]